MQAVSQSIGVNSDPNKASLVSMHPNTTNTSINGGGIHFEYFVQVANPESTTTLKQYLLNEGIDNKLCTNIESLMKKFDPEFINQKLPGSFSIRFSVHSDSLLYYYDKSHDNSEKNIILLYPNGIADLSKVIIVANEAIKQVKSFDIALKVTKYIPPILIDLDNLKARTVSKEVLAKLSEPIAKPLAELLYALLYNGIVAQHNDKLYTCTINSMGNLAIREYMHNKFPRVQPHVAGSCDEGIRKLPPIKK